jgi:hypothetical protein
LVKVKARLLPGKAAMRQDPSGLCFKIVDQIFISHLEQDVRRQDGSPVVHQRLITAVIAPELTEIVGVGLFAHEQGRKAGQAGVDRVAERMDDTRIRKRQMNEADEGKVCGHLVDDPIDCRCSAADAVEISRSELAQRWGRQNYLPNGNHRLIGVDVRDRLAEIADFPGATREWLERICSMSVVPDRGMPTTNSGTAVGSPTPR